MELKSNAIPQAQTLFFVDYRKESAVLNQLNEINIQCNCLTDDIEIIKDYVMNGYSVKEQTDEEYNLFLEEVKKANEGRLKDCSLFGCLQKRFLDRLYQE